MEETPYEKPTLDECLRFMESIADNLRVVAPAYRHIEAGAAMHDAEMILRRTVKEWRAMTELPSAHPKAT